MDARDILEHCPDVIVMGLAMPQFDGITAAERIKADVRTRHTTVILLTGYPTHTLGRDALKRGIDGILTKPCLPEQLKRHVNDPRQCAPIGRR